MESPVNVQGIKGMSIMRKEWKGGGRGEVKHELPCSLIPCCLGIKLISKEHGAAQNC